MRKTNQPIEINELEAWLAMWKDSIPVKNATLHQAAAVGGFATEKTINKDKLIGAHLRWHVQGLLVALKDVRALIPAPNVAMLIFDEAK
jgi:urease accessory protein UreF